MVLITNNGGTNSKLYRNFQCWETAKVVALWCMSGAAAALALVLTFGDPTAWIVKYKLRVCTGSLVVESLQTEAETIYIKVYLFNVTNGDRFAAGLDDQIAVEQVGPFTYGETRVNVDVDMDDEKQLLRYTPKLKSFFMPELSVADPKDVILTLPSLPTLGVASLLSSYGFLARMTFNMLATQLRSQPLIKISAHDYLWGYKDKLVSLAHTALPGVITFEKIGLLEMLYDKNAKHRMEVSTREEDKFSIKTRNGAKKLLMSSTKSAEECAYCDTFDGAYEGILYPIPFSHEKVPVLNLFRMGLCKLFNVEYNETRRLDTWSMDALVYKLNDSFFALNKTLPNDGLLDLSDCFSGLPVVISKGYFLDTTPTARARVRGLPPPNSALNSYAIIDPVLGITLDIYVPLQVNLALGDLRYNSKVAAYSNMVLPVTFLEIKQPPLNAVSVEVLDNVYNKVPIAIIVGQFVLVLTTITLLVWSIRLKYRQRILKREGLFTILSTQDKEPNIGSNTGEIVKIIR